MPEDLRLSRDRYLVLAFAGADALFELDPELRVRWAAGPAVILGRPPELLLGRSFLELLHPREHGMVELLLRGGGVGRVGPALVAAAGGGRRLVLNGIDHAGYGSRHVTLARSVAESMSLSTACDPATGLLPVEGLARLAEHQLELAAAGEEPRRLALLRVGEPAQPPAGPQAETPAAARSALEPAIAACLRASSCGGTAAAALGGGRFALVQLGDDRDALLERRLRSLLASSPAPEVGFGLRRVGLDPAPLNLSQAKQAVRHLLACFARGEDEVGELGLGGALADSLRRSDERNAALRQRLRNGQLDLVYHAVFGVNDRQPLYHEALPRFGGDDGTRELVVLAGDAGWAADFDLAVLERAMRVIAGADKRRPARLGINVAVQSVLTERFGERLMRHVLGRGLDDRLVIELTGSLEVIDFERVDATLQQLRRVGVRVVIDDLVVGPAAVQCVRRLRADMAKLDAAQLSRGRVEGAAAPEILAACAERGIKVIAKRVESEATLAAVRHLGVGFAQGFLFGRPTVDLP